MDQEDRWKSSFRFHILEFIKIPFLSSSSLWIHARVQLGQKPDSFHSTSSTYSPFLWYLTSVMAHVMQRWWGWLQTPVTNLLHSWTGLIHLCHIIMWKQINIHKPENYHHHTPSPMMSISFKIYPVRGISQITQTEIPQLHSSALHFCSYFIHTCHCELCQGCKFTILSHHMSGGMLFVGSWISIQLKGHLYHLLRVSS